MDTAENAAPRSSQELFTEDWQVYRKMVDNDFLFHRGAYDRLRQLLNEEVNRPFSFLDVACGDASMTVDALKGTQLQSYCGIDISKQALNIAERNLLSLDCTIRLEERNYIEALDRWSDRLDIVWIGLSLHHLQAPGKLGIMRRIRTLMDNPGRLVIYENTSPDGESRAKWLERWDAQKSAWTAYTRAEWDHVAAHVHASDFPQTDAEWHRLGADAGFSSTTALFISPSDLFRLYCFRP